MRKGGVCSSLGRPHFFKILLGDFAQHLRIPPSFLKYITDESSEAVLTDPTGRCWPVFLQKSIKGTYFSLGWPEFIQHHALKEHDLLVFSYYGDLQFHVQVFDETACEREYLLSWEDHGVDSDGPELMTLSRRINKIVKTEPDILEDDIHASLFSVKAHRGNPPSSNDPCEPFPIKIERTEPPLPTPHKRGRSFVEAGQAAGSFRSKLPYTVIRMTTTNIRWASAMRFSPSFSREHLPKGRTNMVLRDPGGKPWAVIYIPGGSNQSRPRLGNGWIDFVRGNELEVGDFCVFELIGPAEFQVHIFRVMEKNRS